MFILIIVFALLIGILFPVAAIALGGFIYHSFKKNEDLRRKCLKILVPSAILWFLLIAVNTALVFIYLYINREVLLNFIRGLIN